MFTIDAAASVTDVTCPTGPHTYTGFAQTPCSVTVTGAGGLNLTPSASYSNHTNAGTATASYTFAGDTRTVDVHVRQLRRKLGDDCPVATVWGVGYKVADDAPVA